MAATKKHDTEETVEAEDFGVVSQGIIRRKPQRFLWIVVHGAGFHHEAKKICR
jgi:isopentenyl phosphate kinase